MSAATQSIDTPFRLGHQFNFPLAAGAIIFAGTMVALNATGFAKAASDTAGLKVVGIAQSDVDNSGGADGDQAVDIRVGSYKLNNSGTHAFAAGAEGATAFVEDDNTVSSDKGNNSIAAGVVEQIEEDGVWVHFRPFAHKAPTLAVTAPTTAAAADLATSEALANACKADIAAIKTALVAAGIVI